MFFGVNYWDVHFPPGYAHHCIIKMKLKMKKLSLLTLLDCLFFTVRMHRIG